MSTYPFHLHFAFIWPNLTETLATALFWPRKVSSVFQYILNFCQMFKKKVCKRLIQKQNNINQSFGKKFRFKYMQSLQETFLWNRWWKSPCLDGSVSLSNTANPLWIRCGKTTVVRANHSLKSPEIKYYEPKFTECDLVHIKLMMETMTGDWL